MKPISEVIAEFPPQVLQRYDFSKATYAGALVPMTGVVCPKHGEFQQYSAQFRKDGAGCPTCGHDRRADKRRMDPSDFIVRAKEVHKDRFTYEKTSYVNMTTKVTVSCPSHGDFQISPNKLVYGGQGCPSCGEERRGKRVTDINPGAAAAVVSIAKHAKSYIEKARKVHGDLYDYSQTVYVGAKKKVLIGCKKHGFFEQAAGHHVSRGDGCPSCGQKSAPEEAVASYLSIFTPVVRRDRTIISPRELDIYLPDHKIAVEFCGMYWHSHGDAEDERKNRMRHAQKHRMCAERGIRLITIYETEWAEREPVIKRLLRNAIGKSKGKLMARKCALGRPTTQEAREFYEKYHPQGGGGGGEHYGLYWRDKLVACMRFTFGGNDRGTGAAGRVWTLARYATRVTVSGAAGRLFKAFLAEHDPSEAKSFSDNRLFAGGMYERLGFTMDGDVNPDYSVWSMRAGLRPKSHYQRRMMQARIDEHGIDDSFDHETDPRTEAEMTYAMGARRIYDCGKRRWLWKKFK